MSESQKLPQGLVEAYGKVLEQLGRGMPMKDDTYLAHLVDATVAIVNSVDHLHQLQILPLLEAVLTSPNKHPSHHFLLRLATSVLGKLPGLAGKLTFNLNLPSLVSDLSGEEDEALCPTLNLVGALIKSGEDLEGVWDQLLLPLAEKYDSFLMYTKRAITDLFASYLVTTLNKGMKRMTPKGSEIVARLETEVDQFLKLAVSVGGTRFDQIIELLSNVMNKLTANGDSDSEMFRNFFCPLVTSNLPLDPLLCPESWPRTPSPSLTRLLLTCHPTEEIMLYLPLLLNSTFTQPDLKKLSLLLAAHRPPLLAKVLPDIVPPNMEDMVSDSPPEMFMYILALHKVDTAVEQVAGCSGAVQLLLDLLKRIPDEPPCFKGNHATAFTSFIGKMVSMKFLSDEQMTQMIDPLLQSASLRLSLDESFRVSLLGLLSSVFASSTCLSSSISPLPSLCTLALDSSYWPVQDSALSCMSTLLSNSSLSPICAKSIHPLKSSLATLLTASTSRYVRSSALRTLSCLVRDPSSLLTSLEALGMLPFFSLEEYDSISLNINSDTFFEEYDEIYRRELIFLVADVYKQLLKTSPKSNLEAVRKKMEMLALFMLEKEQDWEVKMNSVDFWRTSFSVSPRSSAWMTGLKIGYGDYESSVKGEFKKLIQEVGGCEELKARCRILVEFPGYTSDMRKREREECEEKPSKVIRVDKTGSREVGFAQNNEESVDDEAEERVEAIESIMVRSHKLMLKDIVRQECDRQERGLQRQPAEEIKILNNNWMKDLTIVHPDDFLGWLKQYKELNFEDGESKSEEEGVTLLMGVLEDILHSTQEASMNDLIDCY